MAFCTQCGAQVPDGSEFCTSCGSRIDKKVNLEKPAGEPDRGVPGYEQPTPALSRSRSRITDISRSRAPSPSIIRRNLMPRTYPTTR